MFQFLIALLTLIGFKSILVYFYDNLKSPVAILRSIFEENIYPRKKVCLKERYGDWAVITGSTDGIGKALSKELAKKGLNIILISRSKDKLIATAREIESEYSVKCKYIEADFSKCNKIYDHIKKELNGIKIGILVNNVGQSYEFPQEFFNVSEEKIWNMLTLNVGATAMMTRLVLNQMKDRKRGLIVNIGSFCQNCPGPFYNMYAAGKAFVKSFTIALQWELNDYNIEVQLLNPAFIRTNMTKFSKDLSTTGFWVADVNQFARSAVSLMGRSNETTGSFYHGIQFAIADLFPTKLQTYFGQHIAKIWNNENLKKS